VTVRLDPRATARLRPEPSCGDRPRPSLCRTSARRRPPRCAPHPQPTVRERRGRAQAHEPGQACGVDERHVAEVEEHIDRFAGPVGAERRGEVRVLRRCHVQLAEDLDEVLTALPAPAAGRRGFRGRRASSRVGGPRDHGSHPSCARPGRSQVSGDYPARWSSTPDVGHNPRHRPRFRGDPPGTGHRSVSLGATHLVVPTVNGTACWHDDGDGRGRGHCSDPRARTACWRSPAHSPEQAILPRSSTS